MQALNTFEIEQVAGAASSTPLNDLLSRLGTSTAAPVDPRTQYLQEQIKRETEAMLNEIAGKL